METLIMDTPSGKKRRVVDMPIYLLFQDLRSGRRGKFRWWVIESRCGSEDTAAAGELLGDEHYVKKSEEDRVRELPLPDIDFDIGVNRCTLIASKSRLFIISCVKNVILYIDLKQRSDQEWKICDGDLNVGISGAAVSDDGDWIYAAQHNLFRFRCDNPQHREIIPDVFPDPDHRPSSLLGLTSGSKLLMYDPDPEVDLIQAGFYDPDHNSWAMTDSFSVGSVPLNLLPTRAVLVSDSFLILYSEFHPDSDPHLVPLITITIKEVGYCPGLYVYDIRRKKWLSEPVQGITDLPESSDLNIHHVSVMQVRRDVPKLAFVWSATADPELFYWSPKDNIYMEQTEIHWSKFILRIEDHETQDIPPTFHAEGLSSGIIYGGDTFLIKSTAGKDCKHAH